MNTSAPSKLKKILFQLSAILILVSAIVFYSNPLIAKILIVLGASGYGAVTFTTPYPGKTIRGKRFFNLQILSVIFMVVGAYLMCVERMEWVVVLLVAAILTLISSIAISIVYKQEQRDIEQQ